jgi:hypothetical protein
MNAVCLCFGQAKSSGSRRFRRLHLEALETRNLLSTCTVDRLTDNNPNSGGEGSGTSGDLRWCVTESLVRADTINFSVTGTINLAGPLPDLARNVSIEGPGSDLMTVRRDTGVDYSIFQVDAGVTVSISGLTISNGNGSDSSGIYDLGTLTVTGCTISGNMGDGITTSLGTLLTVTNSTMSNNTGAGIICNGIAMVTNCTISGNMRGGIYSGGTLTVSSSTIAGNSGLNGGGIFNAATLTVSNSTIAGNSATVHGGGIYTLSGSMSARNTIIAENKASEGPDVYGNLGSQGHNLLGDPQDVTGFNLDTDLVHVDPLLGPLQDNGGPTFTMALLPGSPAIGAGDPTNDPATDQRGFPRLVNGTIDIGAFEVQGTAVSQLVVSAPSSVTAGSPFAVTVAALDNNGNLIPGYTDTIHFTSSDPQAALPADYTFTAADNGVHTFANEVTLNTAGTQTVSATDTVSGITGSATITVSLPPPPADHFTLSAPGAVVAGSPFDVTVTAITIQGQVATAYTGTVAFTSSDPYPGVVPATYTFTASDQGVHTFPAGGTLFIAGTQTLTVQDTTNSTITGSATIMVSPSSASGFLLAAPPTVIAGTAFNVTVTALDPYGNVATGYTGTVTLTSSDRHPQPADYTFTARDHGTHSFRVSLLTAGAQSLSAWDAVNGSIRGSATVAVSAAPAFIFLVTAPATAVAGTPFDVIVTALDLYGNTDTNYKGTVTFTSSDKGQGVVLPAKYTFTIGVDGDNGVHTFPGGVTLITPGDQDIFVTDAVSGINGVGLVTVGSGGGAAPPPGGGGSRSWNPPMITGMAPAGSVQLGPQSALVDRLFGALNEEDSTPLLLLLKRHRQDEEGGWLLDDFSHSRLCW